MRHSLAKTIPIVAIIGGGCAGMSCALWLKQLGISPHIIEREASLGGQLLSIKRINRWVLGSPHDTSAELAERYRSHISAEHIATHCNTEIIAINASASGYQLQLQTANQSAASLTVQALVIATGVRTLSPQYFAKLDGFNALTAAGFISNAPLAHLDQLAQLSGKTVAVIGGGDNAHFTVNDVAAHAACSYLLMRSTPKAQPHIRAQITDLTAQGCVIEYQHSSPIAFQRLNNRINLVFTSAADRTETITVDYIFPRIGFTPNSDFLAAFSAVAAVNTEHEGYLATDNGRRCSLASVYAVGDVASPVLQSVVTAIADGAIAAKTIAHDLAQRSSV